MEDSLILLYSYSLSALASNSHRQQLLLIYPILLHLLLRCPVRAIATGTQQRKHECTMAKSRSRETTMVKIRKYDDEKSIARWWKVENAEVRRWKLDIISWFHHRTLEYSPSFYRCFVISTIHYRISHFHFCSIALSPSKYHIFTIVVSLFRLFINILSVFRCFDLCVRPR